MTPDRPRVLVVCNGLPPHSVGGAELVAWRTAAALARSGHPTALFARDDAPDAPRPGVLSRREQGDVAQYALGARPGSDSHPEGRAAMGRVLSLWRPDVVWVHHPSGLGVGAVEPVVEEGLPLAVTFHDYWWFCPRGQLLDAGGARCRGPVASRCPSCLAPGAPVPLRAVAKAVESRRWADRRRRVAAVLSAAAIRTAPSEHVARRHREWLDLPVEVLPNPPPVLGRPPLPAPGGPVRVGYFGAIIPSKGAGVLLDAACRVGPERVAVELHGALPVGAPWRSWRHELRARAIRAGARWAGSFSPGEVEARLAGVEVVAVPSVWEENAPLVIDEARAAGRAVLASAIGGIPERLEGTDGARTLPPGDLSAWTSALADTPALRRLARLAHRTPPPIDPTPQAVERVVGRLARR